MNIYDMLDFIRKNDQGGYLVKIADFLFEQYRTGRVEAQDLWYMLKDLMISLLNGSVYDYDEATRNDEWTQ